MGDGNAQPVAICSNAHAGVFMEQPGQVPATDSGGSGKRSERRALRRVLRDGVLQSVHGGVQMVATFQPWRKLWIGSAAA